MVELQAEISYWLSVGIRAVQTFPSFIGNNWVGVLLSLALLLPSVRQQIKEHVTAIKSMAWSGKFFYTGRTLMKTNWRTVGAIVGIFFFGNFLTVGFRDYNRVSDQNKTIGQQLSSVKSQLSQSAVNCQLQTNDIRNERDSEKARNQVLEKQNRDQQSTINGCLTQAMKLLIPVTQKTTALVLDSDKDKDKPMKNMQWLLLTNKSVEHPRILIGCTRTIDSAALSAVGTQTLAAGSSRVAKNAWRVEILSPAWAPTSPLLLKLSYQGDIGMSCSFTPW